MQSLNDIGNILTQRLILQLKIRNLTSILEDLERTKSTIPEWKPVFNKLIVGQSVSLTNDEIVKLQLITKMKLKYVPGKIIVLSFTDEGVQIPQGQEIDFVDQVIRNLRPEGYQAQAKYADQIIPFEERCHESRITELGNWRFCVTKRGIDKWDVTLMPLQYVEKYDSILNSNDEITKRLIFNKVSEIAQSEKMQKYFQMSPFPVEQYQLALMKELEKNVSDVLSGNQMTPEESKKEMKRLIDEYNGISSYQRQNPTPSQPEHIQLFKLAQQSQQLQQSQQPQQHQQPQQTQSRLQKLGLQYRQ